MLARILTLIPIALSLAACASAPRGLDAPAEPYSPLILVSIDGFRADYLDRGITPTLQRLAADGVRAEALKPAFPTLTFPNHYTLVTGLYPDHHGIVDNRMTDPRSGRKFVYKDDASIADPSWWGGEPIWVTAEKHGIRSATMFWPGSNVAILGTRPTYWLPFDPSMLPQQRVERVLEWLDLPVASRPRFVTLYFEQVDHAGHHGGPDSDEVNLALRDIDAALARLIEGLRARKLAADTNLVIVSDHGSASTSPERLIFLDDLFDADVATVTLYGVLACIEPGADRERAERLVLAPHAHMRCWRKDDVPERLHYGTNPRIPPLLCLADDGWIITSHERNTARTRFSLGEHGYDNDDPNMRALFIADGPAFRQGIVVPEFDNVDVYPLLAHLLGLEPQPNDGDPGVYAPMLR